MLREREKPVWSSNSRMSAGVRGSGGGILSSSGGMFHLKAFALLPTCHGAWCDRGGWAMGTIGGASVGWDGYWGQCQGQQGWEGGV